jgi:hypothetical protein
MPLGCQEQSFWHAPNPERFHEFSIFGFGDALGRIY